MTLFALPVWLLPNLISIYGTMDYVYCLYCSPNLKQSSGLSFAVIVVLLVKVYLCIVSVGIITRVSLIVGRLYYVSECVQDMPAGNGGRGGTNS